MKYLYQLSCVISTHELICVCGILKGIFGADTYEAISCEVFIAGGCVLAHLCQTVGYIYP